MSSENKIDPLRDVTVRSEELSKKERKQPAGDFRHVAEQVDERRRSGDDEPGEGDKKDSKKKSPTPLVKSGSQAPDSPVSLFDLARDSGKGREQRKRDEPSMEVADISQDHEHEELVVKKTPEVPTPLIHPQYGIEQHDLASVNPAPLTASAHQAPLSTKSMQEMIDQIVKQVYTVKGSSGINETVVELEGRFKGARLILTEFDAAKKEMNITIDQLKTGLEQQFLNSHKQEIVDKLAKDHQIVVHIFTATTVQEPTQLDERQAREQAREGAAGQQHKQQKEQPEEDETRDA